MYEENGSYYCFLKSEGAPSHVILVKGPGVTGPFTRVEAFDKSMEPLEAGRYEAPTAFRTADGKWCLLLDFYGCSAAFSFPYGFKHGTVLSITDEEYERLKVYRKMPSER